MAEGTGPTGPGPDPDQGLRTSRIQDQPLAPAINQSPQSTTDSRQPETHSIETQLSIVLNLTQRTQACHRNVTNGNDRPT